MVEGDQSPRGWRGSISNSDLRGREVWEGFQEEVALELRVLKDTCRVVKPRDSKGVGQVKGERSSVQAEAAAWAELKSKGWLGTFNMARKEGKIGEILQAIEFILIPVVSEHSSDTV